MARTPRHPDSQLKLLIDVRSGPDGEPPLAARRLRAPDTMGPAATDGEQSELGEISAFGAWLLLEAYTGQDGRAAALAPGSRDYVRSPKLDWRAVEESVFSSVC